MTSEPKRIPKPELEDADALWERHVLTDTGVPPALPVHRAQPNCPLWECMRASPPVFVIPAPRFRASGGMTALRAWERPRWVGRPRARGSGVMESQLVGEPFFVTLPGISRVKDQPAIRRRRSAAPGRSQPVTRLRGRRRVYANPPPPRIAGLSFALTVRGGRRCRRSAAGPRVREWSDDVTSGFNIGASRPRVRG